MAMRNYIIHVEVKQESRDVSERDFVAEGWDFWGATGDLTSDSDIITLTFCKSLGCE